MNVRSCFSRGSSAELRSVFAYGLAFLTNLVQNGLAMNPFLSTPDNAWLQISGHDAGLPQHWATLDAVLTDDFPRF
jgi:hypothetical protein